MAGAEANPKIVDWQAAIEAVDSDKNLLVVLIDTFFEETPILMRKLESSLEASRALPEPCPFGILAGLAKALQNQVAGNSAANAALETLVGEIAYNHKLETYAADAETVFAKLRTALGDSSLTSELDELRLALDRCQDAVAESKSKEECPYRQVERHAHTIKGSLRIFKALGQETAFELELMGKNHKLTNERTVFAKLQEEIPIVSAEFERWKATEGN